jgi:hypothetical protein
MNKVFKYPFKFAEKRAIISGFNQEPWVWYAPKFYYRYTIPHNQQNTLLSGSFLTVLLSRRFLTFCIKET